MSLVLACGHSSEHLNPFGLRTLYSDLCVKCLERRDLEYDIEDTADGKYSLVGAECGKCNKEIDRSDITVRGTYCAYGELELVGMIERSSSKPVCKNCVYSCGIVSRCSICFTIFSSRNLLMKHVRLMHKYTTILADISASSSNKP